MKVLILYACLGGNRYKWDEVANIEVTAVELDPEAARLYKERFPNDTVIVADAHQYLLDHYKEFDFIWSSPPCPSHSRARFARRNTTIAIYPDLKLYEEILFLEGYFEGKWVIENVRSWYNPLIKPFELERHYFWSNFVLPKIKITNGKIELCNGYHKENDKQQVNRFMKEFDFDLSKYNLSTMKARTMLRNCVNPITGKHIFDFAFKNRQEVLV